MFKQLFIIFTKYYRESLAPFLFFRLAKHCTLSLYIFMYSLLCMLRNRNQKAYKFSHFLDYYDILVSEKFNFDKGQVTTIPSPFFFGYKSEVASKKTELIKIKTPRISVFETLDSLVIGGVDFIFVDGIAFHHEYFVPQSHFCPAENVGVVKINRQKSTIKLNIYRSPKSISSAANLLGQCASNYAHWLTETLPKLAILDLMDVYSDVPLLVDDGLHTNIYRSLDILNKKKREIIKVKKWEAFNVKKLLLISQPGYERYVPQNIDFKEADPYVNVFSPTALAILRREVTLKIASKNIHAVYLRRSKASSNLRYIENIRELEEVIFNKNYKTVDVDLMNFDEQVQSVKDAKFLIAPIGASLANMIFAAPGCKVIVLSPYYDGASYHYYTNLACALGHSIYFILGKQTNLDQHSMHRNYSIDPLILADALKEINLKV